MINFKNIMGFLGQNEKKGPKPFLLSYLVLNSLWGIYHYHSSSVLWNLARPRVRGMNTGLEVRGLDF
jgi:hypothetical protein